jgi:hypothetical protein
LSLDKEIKKPIPINGFLNSAIYDVIIDMAKEDRFRNVLINELLKERDRRNKRKPFVFR